MKHKTQEMTAREQAILRHRLLDLERLCKEAQALATPTAITLFILAALFLVMTLILMNLFVGVVALGTYLLAAWVWRQRSALLTRRQQMQRDLDSGTKHVFTGTADACDETTLRRGRIILHTLTVQQQTFKVKLGDYERVKRGDLVRLHVSPRSHSVLCVERLSGPA